MNLAHDKINIDLSAKIRSIYGIKSIIMDNVKHDKNLQIDSIFNYGNYVDQNYEVYNSDDYLSVINITTPIA
jgi:hypothetical protein